MHECPYCGQMTTWVVPMDADKRRIAELEAERDALVEAASRFLEAMSLGPLNAAAKYGPDFDLRQYELDTAEALSAALAKIEGGNGK